MHGFRQRSCGASPASRNTQAPGCYSEENNRGFGKRSPAAQCFGAEHGLCWDSYRTIERQYGQTRPIAGLPQSDRCRMDGSVNRLSTGRDERPPGPTGRVEHPSSGPLPAALPATSHVHQIGVGSARAGIAKSLTGGHARQASEVVTYGLVHDSGQPDRSVAPLQCSRVTRTR